VVDAAGLASGGAEFALYGVYIVVVYAIIRRFGAAGPPGSVSAARSMQACSCPVIAVAFSVRAGGRIEFRGRRADRVRQTLFGSADHVRGHWCADGASPSFTVAVHSRINQRPNRDRVRAANIFRSFR